MIRSAGGEQHRPMERPWVSIVIASYNSARLLPETLKAVDAQVPPRGAQGPVEVLVIDGGSNDGTIEIAEQFGARTIENPLGDPIHAKHIGFLSASSRCVCFLDHDEILLSASSLARKVDLIHGDHGIRVVASSGYEIQEDPSACNAYASEFGDPLSLFMYRTPNVSDRRPATFRRRLRAAQIDDAWVGSELRRPGLLLEVAAGGTVVDADFFLSRFPAIHDDPSLVPHLFYLLLEKGGGGGAILENDPILHRTASSWTQVFTKVAWRIQNGIASTSTLGRSGLSGRPADKHIPLALFLPYTLLIFPAAVDAVYLAVSRRRFGYLMHFPLSLYVTLSGAYAFLKAKLSGGRHQRSRYDGTPLNGD